MTEEGAVSASWTKEFNLPCFGIKISLVYGKNGSGWGGSITSDLEESCGCVDAPPHPDDGPCSICAYNSAVDGIESLILAHACAGIDISTPAYIEGIETAVGAAGNNS